MKHDYTLNFLVKYLYKETPILKRLEIENAIEEDGHIRREYHKLKKAYKLLPKVSFYPTDETIANVINYSRNNSLNPSF